MVFEYPCRDAIVPELKFITRSRTLMLLGATALAVLLAGCGGSVKEDGSSPRNGSSSSQDGSSSQVSSASAANTNSVDRRAGSGGTDRQQQERGEVSNGKIVVQRTTGGTNDIYVINKDGTTEAHLTHAENEDRAVLSPDGEKIAFVRPSPPDPSITDIYVMDADGTDEIQITRNVLPGISRILRGTPVWSPDSKRIAFISYTSESTDTSSSTDPETAPAAEMNGIYVANVDGRGVCMIRKLPNINPSGEEPTTLLTWSPDGDKIASSDNDTINVIKADDKGRWELINTIYGAQRAHAWSPDGKRIVLVDQSDSDLYVVNFDGSKRRPLTNTAAPDAFPSWSPDGERIAFFSGAVGPSASASPSASADNEGESAYIYVINAGGTGMRRLANSLVPEAFPAWSSDGKKLAFFCPGATGAADRTELCMINADGTKWKRLSLDVYQY
jgi:Tol biopolymer transport system component